MKRTLRELSYNAWTDAWLPLVQPDGRTVWGSPVEVLAGEKDGVDLDYPRDDFRVYARLLLSALVQALFPAANNRELQARLDTPMKRRAIEKEIAPVLEDFDLFGPAPFLQIAPSASPSSAGAAPFAFPGEDLFRAAVPVDAISLPTALVVLFVEQTYAGGAGRGYGAGPGGQPGAFTLIDPGSVRQAAWANTLTSERVAQKYAKEGACPWTNKKQPEKPRSAIGLVQGLFYQPRGVWLIPTGEGRCSFSGLVGPLVRRSPLLSKSQPAKKPPGGEDLWQHPCAPLAVNSQGIGAIRLNAERPAWTGLAQLLHPLSRGKKTHPAEGPAPVLQQWTQLSGRTKRPRLLVLDFDRDKANVKRRFFEGYALSDHLLGNTEAIEALRARTDDAQGVRLALVRALLSAHDGRKHGGFAMADAESAFWAASDGPFHDWLDAMVALGGDDDDAAERHARERMEKQIRRTALEVFDAHVALSEFEPTKQARIAQARRRLLGALYPKPATDSVPKLNAHPNAEVIP